MNAPIDRNDDAAPSLDPGALHAFAGELPLELLLQEMRDFYGAGDDPSVNLDYEQICDAWIQSLDDALGRLQNNAQ